MDALGIQGSLYGVIPAQDLIDNVVDPMIPEEGYNGTSKEQLLTIISGLKDNPNLMDQDLDGEPGVSVAFRFAALPEEWVTEAE